MPCQKEWRGSLEKTYGANKGQVIIFRSIFFSLDFYAKNCELVYTPHVICICSEAVRKYPNSIRAIYGDPYNDSINAVHGSGKKNKNGEWGKLILIK